MIRMEKVALYTGNALQTGAFFFFFLFIFIFEYF